MRIPFLKKERVDLSEPKNNLKEGKTEEPVYSKTIAGFRVWRIDEENLVLTSVTNNNPWHSGLNFANGCRKHAAPGSKCHCGFNAFYDLDTLDESAYKSLGIVGAFAGAGTVYIHKDGFRSSEAQLTALFYDEENLVESKETVEKIAYRYRVPLFDSRDEFLKYVSSVLPDLDRSELNLPEEKLDQFKNPRKKNLGEVLSIACLASMVFVPFLTALLWQYFTGEGLESSSDLIVWGWIIFSVLFLSSGIGALYLIDSRYRSFVGSFVGMPCFILGIALMLVAPGTDFSGADRKEQNMLYQSELVRVSQIQDDYYKKHGIYTDDEKFIESQSGIAVNRTVDYRPRLSLELSKNKKDYLLAEKYSEELLAVKGSSGSVSSYCKSCDSKELDFKELQPIVADNFVKKDQSVYDTPTEIKEARAELGTQ